MQDYHLVKEGATKTKNEKKSVGESVTKLSVTNVKGLWGITQCKTSKEKKINKNMPACLPFLSEGGMREH